MAQALRSTTSVRRPVDMFFLPSDAAEKVEVEDAPGVSSELNKSPETTSSTRGASTSRSQAGRNDDVSRETSNRAPATPTDDKTETESSAQQAGQGPTHADTDTLSADSATIGSRKESTRAPAAGGTDDTATSGVYRAVTADDSGHETPSAPSAPGSDDVSRETSPNAVNHRNDEDLAMVPGTQFAEVLVKDIHPNRKQPRQVFDEDELAELAFSVKELGVLQPVVVRPSREDEGAKYELVMGERRWRAVQKAGLDSIPAIIRETSDDDLLRDALLENLHRSQLNPLEEAAAYQQLLEEFGATQDELSQRIGRSRPQISNTLRLLRLPPLVQRRVAAGVLSSGHARALLGLTDPAEMERLAQRIVAEGMSVRATEETVALSDGLKRHATKRKTPTHRHDDRLNYIADAFSDRLDTSVKIQLGARKGKMTIEFASVEDLNRIIDVLDPKMEDRK
ncbi:MAG: ParB/RepB/Spo0J family partition protein [Kocuria sp.]|nr:ParB/RepB/Spo0J family partition protein [Kocuria sp.]